MVRDNLDNIDDGADEKMLGVGDTDKLANKDLEVKFIQGVETNGDAQIDILDVRKVNLECHVVSKTNEILYFRHLLVV